MLVDQNMRTRATVTRPSGHAMQMSNALALTLALSAQSQEPGSCHEQCFSLITKDYLVCGTF
jgi:hypothetical protein